MLLIKYFSVGQITEDETNGASGTHKHTHTHIHTHTHTHTHIYIYIEREREKRNVCRNLVGKL
jgi:hypothetical protein